MVGAGYRADMNVTDALLSALVVIAAAAFVVVLAILRKAEHIVTELDQLNTAQAADAADLTQLTADANALVVLLQQVEQNQNVDLSGPIAAATALGQGIAATDAAVQAALANPGGPSPTGQTANAPVGAAAPATAGVVPANSGLANPHGAPTIPPSGPTPGTSTGTSVGPQ